MRVLEPQSCSNAVIQAGRGGELDDLVECSPA